MDVGSQVATLAQRCHSFIIVSEAMIKYLYSKNQLRLVSDASSLSLWLTDTMNVVRMLWRVVNSMLNY